MEKIEKIKKKINTIKASRNSRHTFIIETLRDIVDLIEHLYSHQLPLDSEKTIQIKSEFEKPIITELIEKEQSK